MATVRQQINVPAAPRAVWRAFTTAEGLAGWWVDEARVDAREGGRVVITTEDDDGKSIQVSGIYHEFRPTRKIGIRWDPGTFAPLSGTQLEITLARDGEDTRVVLVQTGIADAAVETGEKAWRQALRGLRDSLDE